MAHPLVEGLGIAELERTLIRLTSHPHVVQSASSTTAVSPEMVHEVIKHINRLSYSGPRIRSQAIQK